MMRRITAIGGVLLGAHMVMSASAQDPRSMLDLRIQEVFDVERYGLQVVTLDHLEDGSLIALMQLEGEAVTMRLRPHSNRAPGFRVSVRDGRGRLTPIVAPPLATYRGVLEEHPDSVVSATVIDGHVRGLIRTGDHIWGVQPLASHQEFAGDTRSIVYRQSDVLPGPWICGTESDPEQDVPLHRHRVADPSGGGLSCLTTVKIAFETDYEYFLLNQMSVPTLVLDIESVLDGMNIIFDRDVGITHLMTEIVVQVDEADPYFGSDADNLITQFKNHWNLNHSSTSNDPIDRDVAHFMTGRDLLGPIIGIAEFGTMCGTQLVDSGYSVAQTFFSPNLAFRVADTAHELGHNWHALHCDGDPDCAVMNSVIGAGPGGLGSLGNLTRTDIQDYFAFIDCLQAGSPPAGPDCNLNCIVDSTDIAGGFSADCNADGVPDECELASGLAGDCNLNGVPDTCEDCNLNGLADECELLTTFYDASPVFSPFGLTGVPTPHTFAAPPPPVGDVTFTFTANAPLLGAETVMITLNDTPLGPGQVFFTGVDCPVVSVEDVVITAAEFLSLTGGGDATVGMMTFDFLTTSCNGNTSIQVELAYDVDLALDTNDNGLLDVCECDEDCSGDLDGNVGIEDFLAVLADWGSPSPCDFEPAGGNGTVGIEEFLAVLAKWGSCFTP